MKAEIQTNERPDSFKISINAKGLWSGEVKVYAETVTEAKEKCLKEAKELSILIAERNK